jgi:hypothetical protein
MKLVKDEHSERKVTLEFTENKIKVLLASLYTETNYDLRRNLSQLGYSREASDNVNHVNKWLQWKSGVESAYDGPIPYKLKIMVYSFNEWLKVYGEKYV